MTKPKEAVIKPIYVSAEGHAELVRQVCKKYGLAVPQELATDTIFPRSLLASKKSASPPSDPKLDAHRHPRRRSPL